MREALKGAKGRDDAHSSPWKAMRSRAFCVADSAAVLAAVAGGAVAPKGPAGDHVGRPPADHVDGQDPAAVLPGAAAVVTMGGKGRGRGGHGGRGWEGQCV